jgi:hypothetical protein
VFTGFTLDESGAPGARGGHWAISTFENVDCRIPIVKGLMGNRCIRPEKNATAYMIKLLWNPEYGLAPIV